MTVIGDISSSSKIIGTTIFLVDKLLFLFFANKLKIVIIFYFNLLFYYLLFMYRYFNIVIKLL
jgi:hypothetical protein